jgi:hypothetical protein
MTRTLPVRGDGDCVVAHVGETTSGTRCRHVRPAAGAPIANAIGPADDSQLRDRGRPFGHVSALTAPLLREIETPGLNLSVPTRSRA